MSKAAVFFDLDSTLVSIEGAVELAKKKGVLREVEHLTEQAMEGNVPFEQIILQRHKLLAPNLDELVWLGQRYIETIVPGVLERLKELGQVADIFILTAGYSVPTYIVAKHLEVPLQNVYPQLWFKDAKSHTIKNILANRDYEKTILVGDGANDLVAKEVVDTFIAAAYVVRRALVVDNADYVAYSVDELRSILFALLGSGRWKAEANMEY